MASSMKSYAVTRLWTLRMEASRFAAVTNTSEVIVVIGKLQMSVTNAGTPNHPTPTRIEGMDMNAKHTPGPWTVIHNSWDASTVYDAAGNEITRCFIRQDVTEENQAVLEAAKDANANL